MMSFQQTIDWPRGLQRRWLAEMGNINSVSCLCSIDPSRNPRYVASHGLGRFGKTMLERVQKCCFTEGLKDFNQSKALPHQAFRDEDYSLSENLVCH